MITIKILSGVPTPTKTNPSDAGWDLTSSEDLLLESMVVTKVPTGLYMAIPEGYYGQIFDRSSMGSKGKHVFGGVLDSSYRGNVMVCLYNSGAPYWVKKGDRIAQLVILPVPEVKWEVVDKLDNSERGENGFGSSGQ